MAGKPKRKRMVVIRQAALVEAAEKVLKHRDAARAHDSALRKVRDALRPYAEKGHDRVRIGKALVSLEWQGGQKTVVPDDVKEKYTTFDEHARLSMRLESK